MMSRTSLGALLAGSALCLLGLSNGCGSDETTATTTASTTNSTTNTTTNIGGGGSGNQGGTGPGGGGSGGSAGSTSTNANCSPPSGTEGGLQLTEVITGLNQPIGVAVPWGDTERIFVIEKPGAIQMWKNGQLSEFLDLSGKINDSGERGLLGLAFHPDYNNNGRFFVHFSAGNNGVPNVATGDTVIAEYRRDPNNPDVADPNPVIEPLLTVAQPFGNHNGGAINFNPVDGFLYIALGDGGSGGDPQGNGQNKNTLLAALLRIDVNNSSMAMPYETPAGNITDGAPEIFDWGLRNPFRFSFDICTGDRYIGDVGQNAWEEVDVASASQGPTNWGWNTMEADECYNSANCDMTGLALPVAKFPTVAPTSVTGGVVYRGSAIPWLRGMYLYNNFSNSSQNWKLRWENGALVEAETPLGLTMPNIGGYALDNDGEVWMASINGSVYRLDPQ